MELKIQKNPFLRYLSALLSVAVVSIIRLFAVPIVEVEAPFLLFAVAVIIAAYIGGFGPGIFATILCALVIKYFFLFPKNSFAIIGFEQAVNLVLFASEGTLVAYIVDWLRQSIENQKQYEEKLKELKNSLGLSYDAIIIRDFDGTIRFWNRGAQELYGWSEEEAIGKKVHLFFETKFSEPLEEINSKLRKNGRWEGELTHIFKDKRVRIVESRWVLHSGNDGQAFTVLQIDRDITFKKKAEEALKQSEERIRLITDALPVLISLVDKEYKYQLCNKTYETWFGIPREQIIGKSMSEILGESAWSKIAPRIQVALNGKAISYQDEVIYKTAGRRWIDVSYIPQFDPNGNVKDIVVLVNDITRHKDIEEALERREEQLRLFFELNPIGMGEADPVTRRFTRVNKKLCEITGYSQEELLQRSFKDITHPEDLPEDLALIEKITKRELDTYHREKRYLRKDGTIVWVSVAAKVLYHEDGAPYSAIGTVEDITPRKQYEGYLRQARNHLERVVEERTSELTAAVEELRRSNKELEAFAYIASHDLQEPLRMITSYVQMIDHHFKTGELGEHMSQYIAYAVGGAERMRKLITDLLDYSRVRSRPLEIKALSLEDILKEAISNLQASISESHAEIAYDLLPILPGDHFEMLQLFQNLLSNAIKFKSDKTPRIHISASKLNADFWQFSIKDNGIGIPSEYRDRIFQIFQRLHPRDRYPGTGIGLAICKMVVERHDGRIWVEPNPDGGSIFTFTLPTKLPVKKLIKSEKENRFSPEAI